MNRMKTGKILNTFLIVFLCATTIPVNAQRDDWKELCDKNKQLEKEIMSLFADTTSLHQTIEKFDAEQMRLNSQIDSIVVIYNDLKGCVESKKIAKIQQNIDSLNTVVKQLTGRKKELESINNQKETALSDLKRNISAMGAFSAIKDEQTFSQYQELLLKPYSEITSDNLREIESKMNSFSKLSNFAEFKTRFNACKKNKKLYDDAEGLLYNKFNPDMIDKTRDKLFELLDIKKSDFRKGIVKLSDVQYSEIDTLDIKLSRYGDGIVLLQGIVKTVNASNIREQNQGNKASCIDALRLIVVSETKEDIEKRHHYFDMIPSLNTLYMKYWDDLQADPFTYPTKSETLIMQLNNE